jgi:hypothetical protein
MIVPINLEMRKGEVGKWGRGYGVRDVDEVSTQTKQNKKYVSDVVLLDVILLQYIIRV